MKLEKLCRESGDVIREEGYQSGSVLETELFNTDGLRRGCDAVRIDCERTNVVTEVNVIGVVTLLASYLCYVGHAPGFVMLCYA